jgi:hypothetical protein
MATLQSPGVSVSIINESFYTPAAPGTVPLIFVASAQDKKNPSGAVAQGTTLANSGKVYLVTSQRDLTDTFGTPLFYTDASGNPIHGGELNEYGLQAAYSLLGVSSAAYITRAPIDLSQLSAASSTPAGTVADGSYWADTADSLYGIFEWNKTKGTFTNKTPLVIDDSNESVAFDSLVSAPKSSFGLIGQYCVVLNQVAASEVHIFYKNTDANWVEVGSRKETAFAANGLNNDFKSTVWSTSFPAALGTATPTTVTVGTGTTFTLNGLSVGIANSDTPYDIAQKINNTFHQTGGGGGIGAKVVKGALAIYVDAATTSSVTIAGTTDILTALGLTAGAKTAPTVFVGPHTQYPDFSSNVSGSVYLKTTSPNAGAAWVVKQWSASANAWNTVKAPVYASVASATYNLDKTGGGANIPVGTVFVESNYDHGDNSSTSTAVIANYKLYRRAAVSPTTITSAGKAPTVSLISTSTFTIDVTEPGGVGYTNTATITVGTGTNALDKLALGINNAGVTNVSATIKEIIADTLYSLTITHATGGEIRFKDDNNVLGTLGFTASGTGTTANYYELDKTIEPSGATHKASNWKPMTFTASTVPPTTTPASGQLWYSSIIDQADIMVHDGNDWRGYRNVFPATDPLGPIVSASKPTTQSDGETALANGDIWISLAGGTEMYGQEIYVYDGAALSWVQQDVTDQTSPTGTLFRDARWAASGSATSAASIADLLLSDYLDPDAPDPAEYPRGMRLFNLRRSGFNIKKFVKGYININANDGKNLRNGNEDMADYSTDRWVSVSPNNADGSGTFGRHAQRSFVVAALKATIDGNQAIRDTDTLTFNLIAAPGYPEAIQNMVALNVDRGLTAFVVGDTSMRLEPTGTALAAYGLNTNGALDNGDTGLVSYNEYMAVFYPSGYTNDLTGNYIVVPPSHMMLRTIAVSDQKSYPWFAPAGIRRGVVDNATSVGYLKDGEFRTAALPQSVRDVMAQKGKINPIATITGAGIINFGQYTRANAASALDRINVARLVAYLRRQLDVLSRPFLFEPNDKITRNEIKNSVQKLLLELVGQRALYDFIVVCDESNNTPARIDRSELWVDVAIEPVKAVEFIYIPVRLVNTGAIKAGTFTLA